LPATVANGTNRVGILIQNVSAVWTFRRAGYFPLGLALVLSVPAVVGAILGARLAVVMGDEAFRRALGLIMLVMTLLTLWTPRPARTNPVAGRWGTFTGWRLAGLLGVFFLIGVYGGFVQAGIGFLIIASMSVMGMDLISTNAIKLLIILILTVPAFAVFVMHGKILYGVGAVLGIGNMIGAQLATRTALQKGHAWIKKFITWTVILVAVFLLVW